MTFEQFSGNQRAAPDEVPKEKTTERTKQLCCQNGKLAVTPLHKLVSLRPGGALLTY